MGESRTPPRGLRWLRPPVVADEESRRVARLLHITLLTNLFTGTAAALVHVFALGAAGNSVFIYPPFLLVSAALLVTLGQGRIHGVALAMQVLFLLAIVGSAFTDGGLRRGLEKDGNKFLAKKLSTLKFNTPITIAPEALLDEAQKAFKEHKVDTLSVSENGKQLGMLDIQDMMKAIAG